MNRERIDDLAVRFVAGTIPHAEWTHAAHLVVGTWHVHRYGVARVLAGPLAAKDLLSTFYSRERMISAARAEWVEPDLAPVRCPR